MRAVILAGGKGVRLRPYTATLPKPLVPVGDEAVLEHVIRKLKKEGVDHITVAVSHLAHLIQSYLGSGERWGLKIDYSVEDRPLSTIAPLKLIGELPPDFLVLNGDVLTDLDVRDLYEHHRRSGAEITVATYERDSQIDFGVIELSEEDEIVGFREKPTYHFNVSMGVYVISRRLLDIVPNEAAFGFDDLMYACIEQGRRAVCFRHRGEWLDIGRPDDYALAQEWATSGGGKREET